MAELISKEIFSVFGWSIKGFKNYSWPCALPERHRKKATKKTHPTDAVFRYFDPYTNQYAYVIADLKSYSKGTIQSADLAAAMRSLGQTVECAKVAPEWQAQYIDPQENADVVGMLFVFNHDNALDRDFLKLLDAATPGKIHIPKQQRIFVFSPERIVLLNSVAKDILSLRGSNALPPAADCSFVFPDLIRHKSYAPRSGAATIEQLLGPWIVLCFRRRNVGVRGKVVYWLDRVTSIDDFKYLFDYLFRYQMVDEDETIEVRCVTPDAAAFSCFEIAKEQYTRDYWPLAGMSERQTQKRMSTLRLEAISSLVECFSQAQIGFRDV